MLAAGYRAIDAEFPIFIDAARNEYALARRERKTGPGHRGFAVEFDPSVTLQEDRQTGRPSRGNSVRFAASIETALREIEIGS